MIGGIRQPLLTENRKVLEESRKLGKLVSSRDMEEVILEANEVGKNSDTAYRYLSTHAYNINRLKMVYSRLKATH